MFLAFFFPEKKKTPKDQLMGKLVEIKRRRVEIEKRKALALERIASALEMKKKNKNLNK